MAHITPSSAINISLTPSIPFATKKNNFLTRCSIPRRLTRQTLAAQKYTVPLSTSIILFPQFRIGCGLNPKPRIHVVSASGAASGTDVVEETKLSTEDKEASVAEVGPSEANEEVSAKSDASSIKSKRPRQGRKSEMPPVKNEDLTPGATFTGKVRSIQPFGAFVDFGAFTDGLVHVSRLSDSFVKDVTSIVTVGQEVTVRLIEANMETGRISLSMRESDDPSNVQQQRDSPISSDKSRPPRKTGQKFNQKRDDSKKSKFIRGQDLEGTVKNITRSGAFISLPEGEEGFLPTSEEADEGFGNVMGGSSLEVGQEVSVRVLRIARGQATLTMKKQENVSELDAKLNQGVVHTATNPFVLAFRHNEAISEFLDKRDQENELAGKAVNGKESLISTTNDALSKTLVNEEVETLPENGTESVEEVEAHSVVLGDDKCSPTEGQILEESSLVEAKEDIQGADISGKVADLSSEIDEEADEKAVDDAIVKDEAQIQTPDAATSSASQADSGDHLSATQYESEPLSTDQTLPNIVEEVTPVISDTKDLEAYENDPEAELSTKDTEEKAVADAIVEDEEQSQKQGDSVVSGDLLSTTESEGEEPQLSAELIDQPFPQIVEEVAPKADDNIIVKDEDQSETEDSTDPSITENEEVDSMESSTAQSGLSYLNTDTRGSVVNAGVGEELENVTASESETQTSSTAPNGNISIPSKQSDEASPTEATTTAAISPALVKQLREETGAGMMDCKRALSETGGDIVKAQEYLRKKGLASADKKATRATAEGRIGSYIHDSRIGVLIEVNCETDFVARGDIFRELVEDLAMQVAACPQVQYLDTEEVPKEIVEKEKEIEMQKEDLLSKPEQIRSKIVEGRIKKRLEELALLEQPFIKDDKVVVKDWVKQTISTIGENIKVKRFVRYNLGEGLEKKSQDFAAEVAAQTAAKTVSSSVKQEPAALDTNETVEPPKPVVSAALVKQLREETGAGMMDCKKALSETGGDLQQAQEYLRKKGLSTADKKSSRLAAEGRIGSYIHDSRIGVLIEVNCETDFVGRGQNFKELVDNLAMQVAACPQVQNVSIEDIPEEIVNREKELELQREDIQSKPENIREKIVEGRVNKRLGELTLLEQPFIRDDSLLVKDLVKQTVATLGENIKVRRFVRFTLGETRDAKSGDEEKA